MTRACRKRAAVDTEDRISALPTNVIDHILELLPVNDASKTCVLSHKWRYTWTMCPYLVLDRLFCDTLARKSQYVFSKTVDKMLLQHVGVILKFHLDVSGVHLSSDKDIDAWMLYVIRNSVKQLTLTMSDNNRTYKLPSCVFQCPTLTHLNLSNCLVKLPNSFVGFQNLIELYLEKITFMPTSEFCVIKAPVLANLTLRKCVGARYLKIVSPQLARLVVDQSQVELNCFINCKKLAMVLLVRMVVDNQKYDERLALEKLLLSLSALKILHLSSRFLELLSAGTIPKELSFTFDLVFYLSFCVNIGNLGHISCALQLMKCPQNLRGLEIWVEKDIATGDDAEAVLEYLNTPTCLDRPLNKVKHVGIQWFKGSIAELLFIKLLLARTPSLKRINIAHSIAVGSTKEKNIRAELMRFPKASSKAVLFWLPAS